MSAHILKIKEYFERINHLDFPFAQELASDVILTSLTSSYKQFTIKYYINGLEKSTMELHGLLKKTEENSVPPRNTRSTTLVLAIREGGVKRKRSSHPNVKGKKERECW